MTIDLTDMTPEMTRELNQIVSEYRKPYTEFVDSLSEIYGKNKFWWDTPFASRNIYQCKCFENICLLRLALRHIEDERPERIIVPSRELKRAILNNATYKNVNIAVRKTGGIKAIIKRTRAFQQYALARSMQWKRREIEAISACGKASRIEAFRGKRVVLVESPRIADEIRDGQLHDRYFPGLHENTDESILFISYLCYETVEEKNRLLTVLLEGPDTACYEEFVEAADYKEAARYIKWCRKLNVGKCRFDEMDVRPLVSGAIRDGSGEYMGILMGRSLCRMVKRYEIKPIRLIDWYEGQASSNAMIRRIRAKHPDIPTIGYVNFPPDELEMEVFPSEAQLRANAVPETYAVIGEAFREMYRQYAPEAKVILAPALRFQDVFDSRAGAERTAGAKKCVLVALPYFTSEATYILSLLEGCADYINAQELEIILKNHPVNAEYSLSAYGMNAVHFKYHFVDGRYDEAVEQADLVITASSTSSFETVLHGKPVVSVCQGGLCTPMMPREWEGVHYGIAYDAADLEVLLQKFLSEGYQSLSEPNRYAVKLSKENLKQLLGG